MLLLKLSHIGTADMQAILESIDMYANRMSKDKTH